MSPATDRLSGLEADLKAVLGRLRSASATGNTELARKALGQIQEAGQRLSQLQAEVAKLADLHEAVTDAYDDATF